MCVLYTIQIGKLGNTVKLTFIVIILHAIDV